MSPDLAHVTAEIDQEPRTLNAPLAEPVFAGLLADWSRHVRGGITAAQLTGAAVQGCAPGTGWPLRPSR
jgi:hypothetical protein